MKKLFTLAALACTFGINAQVRVEEKSVNIEGSKMAFTFQFPTVMTNKLKKH
ncbi:MAG: hypothetical protein IPM77_04065 [Crocinitomicaceae bacterium]|nr:hypothetical protein [Crocinitomicaceae bacterium]